MGQVELQARVTEPRGQSRFPPRAIAEVHVARVEIQFARQDSPEHSSPYHEAPPVAFKAHAVGLPALVSGESAAALRGVWS